MRALVLAGWFAFAPVVAQELGTAVDVPAHNRQYVSYSPESQTLTAGKRVVLELRFRVADGFHINSHKPTSDLLLPTLVEVEPDKGVTASEAIFPAGSTYSFDFDPKEKLDVYQGSFTVQLPVVATAGAHELHATLSYQACNRAACFPPRSLPVAIEFTAK